VSSPGRGAAAPFSTLVKNKLNETYGAHCAVCLVKLPRVVIDAHCAPVLDASPTAGDSFVSLPEIRGIRTPTFFQVSLAAELGVIPAEYDLGSERNGMIREYICPGNVCDTMRITVTDVVHRVSHLPSIVLYDEPHGIFAPPPCIKVCTEVHCGDTNDGSETIARGMTLSMFEPS
jgi:hypothetical protein